MADNIFDSVNKILDEIEKIAPIAGPTITGVIAALTIMINALKNSQEETMQQTLDRISATQAKLKDWV